MPAIQAKKHFFVGNRALSDGEVLQHHRSELHGIAWWWECRCGSKNRALRMVRPADAKHAYSDMNDSLPTPVALTGDGPWWQCTACDAWYNAR
jgi:hypothetical protein